MSHEQRSYGSTDVAVVVPVRNEVTTVSALVQVLLVQTCPPSKIVLVEAGSTDGTRGLVSKLVERHEAVEMVDAGPAGPGRARDVGIGSVDTDLVLLIDAGMWASEGLMEELLEPFEGPVRLVLGSRRIQPGSVWRDAAAITAVKRRLLVDGLWGRFELTPCVMERRLWVDSGGFKDWRAGEDLEFLNRLGLAEDEVAFAPRAEVVWDVALGPVRLFRKWSAYAFHNAQQGSSWHRPVLLWNFGGALVAAVGVSLLGPLGAALGVWPHLVRTAIRVSRYRTPGDREVGRGPVVLLAAVLASVLVDLAVLLGYLRSCLGRAPREW